VGRICRAACQELELELELEQELALELWLWLATTAATIATLSASATVWQRVWLSGWCAGGANVLTYAAEPSRSRACYVPGYATGDVLRRRAGASESEQCTRREWLRL
jgi:hypothetical protein